MFARLIPTLFFSLSLAAGTAALAQDAAPETAPETEATELPPPGQFYFRNAAGDWQLRCVTNAEEPPRESCQMYQLLTNEAGTAVAQFTMVPLGDGGPAAAGATITTPLGTLLTQQVVMAIDSNAPRAYPFLWCESDGCSARVGLTAEEVDNMRKGAKATIQIFSVAQPQTPVLLSLSLIGFTDSFAVLEQTTQMLREDFVATSPAE